MTWLSVPEHVRESSAPHGGSVLLDVRSGHCFAMNPIARALWQEWRRSRDFDSAVHVMASRYPEPHHERIRQDARRLADDLISRGLLTVGGPEEETEEAGIPERVISRPVNPAPATLQLVPAAAKLQTRAHRRSGGRGASGPVIPSAAAEMLMAATPVRPAGTRKGRGAPAVVVGLLGLLLALFLIRLPFRIVFRVVRWTARGWCRREATPRQAAASLTAVRRAAGLYPGRAACLEVSLATLAVLAFTGRRAVWCIGTADDPYRFHAWVEAQGVPVTPPDEYGNGAFRRVLSV